MPDAIGGYAVYDPDGRFLWFSRGRNPDWYTNIPAAVVHLKQAKFFCDAHVDKSLSGWWLTTDRAFCCDQCPLLATWVFVDVSAAPLKTEGLNAVPAGPIG